MCLIFAWFIIKWNFANAVAETLDNQSPESKIVAEWLTRVAPNDPQTHFTFAGVLEKTFDPDDLKRALTEYETAVALAPDHYNLWLSLGKARNLNGDANGAEAAYAKALELAPNNGFVQWAYGNSLIRQGNPQMGFPLLARAAATNPDYSRQAVVTALQVFDGDVQQTRSALGDTAATNSALAVALANQGSYDASYDAWSALAPDDRTGKFKKLGEELSAKMIAEKKFRLAVRFAVDVLGEAAAKPAIGAVSNGGFEQEIKRSGAGPFEWQIADGGEPKIGLSDGQKRSGRYALFIAFDSFDSAAFRSISQIVAVVPGGEYEFEAYYRSDVRSEAKLKWEFVDNVSNTVIGSTPAIEPAGDWATLQAKFTTPANSDGVTIRLVREGCNGPSCPMRGKLSFDDISIKQL